MSEEVRCLIAPRTPAQELRQAVPQLQPGFLRDLQAQPRNQHAVSTRTANCASASIPPSLWSIVQSRQQGEAASVRRPLADRSVQGSRRYRLQLRQELALN